MIYRTAFRMLRRIPPELVHSLALDGLALLASGRLTRAALRRACFPPGQRLRVRALGTVFPSPLGAAAGLDKGARWFTALGAIGFGFVEVGTVTPRAQEPNPPPRLRRLPADRALLNRMGFPNPGAAVVAERLRRRDGAAVVGANLGKARDTPLARAAGDYRAAAAALAALADYVVVNVSSPNTPGLRELESAELLAPLLGEVRETLAASGRPLLVKISPDLDDAAIDAIADLALAAGLDGIVAVNTTLARAGLSDPAPGEGGISGAPLKARSLAVLRRLRGRVGDRLVLVSVGGVESADDVWERVRAGATLVQAYTGFVYGGPAWPRRINRELDRRLAAAGLASIRELVGSGAPSGREDAIASGG
ncbi:MAG: quinone-dependent dihydroorotate dehydrogenase [Solirubrobacterales bacterium]|nr:quinone-dependent dihydroorotate dehydrogenase [Solirubrobacterales bacterium]